MNDEAKKEFSEFHYIYFNEIHDKLKEIKIEIAHEYEGFNSLETFDGKNPFQSANDSNPEIKIYRLKLYPHLFEQKQENKQIIINLEQLGKKEEFILNL